MSGIDKATWRVVTLVVLLVVAAVALRGYLPGSEQAAREHSVGNAAALFLVVALLGVAVAVVASMVGARSRNRRVKAASSAGRPEWFRGGERRVPWRALQLWLGLIVGYLVVVFLLALLFRQLGIDQPPHPGSSTPTPGSDTRQPAPQPPSESGGGLLGYVYAATAGLLLLLVVGAIVAARRRRRAAATSPLTRGGGERSAPDVQSESLARAAELGLAEVGDVSRGPRAAIIACYASMERELTNVPGAVPQDFDTPSEVLARAVGHSALRADSASQLVQLFTEARFSVHAMNEGHRDEAVRALRQVLAQLGSAA